jgi:HK97 family phage portal protein
VIVRTRHNGNMLVENRDEWGTSWLIPQAGYQWLTSSGVPITSDTAYGLSAVSNVIRSPSEIIASLPFESTRAGKPALDSWQWQLLHEEPDELGTGCWEFFYDLCMSIEGSQNAFVQKAKSRTRVEAVYIIDPQRVKVYRDPITSEKLFDVYLGPNDIRKRLTAADILHIRGFSKAPGEIVGTSLLQIHRESLGVAVALQGYEGDYFKNNATMPFFFKGASNKQHATDLLAMHNEQHQGVGKQFKVGAVWGQTDIVPLPAVSLADAQYAEAKRISIEEACRIWRWPKELLEMTTTERLPTMELAWQARIMKYYIMPRLARIQSAFAADRDLFLFSGLVGKFDTDALERADFQTRMASYKDARQGGWITANEIRKEEGFDERPDGDTLLVTPTGSAPNPEHAPAEPSSNGSKNGAVSFAAVGGGT